MLLLYVLFILDFWLLNQRAAKLCFMVPAKMTIKILFYRFNEQLYEYYALAYQQTLSESLQHLWWKSNSLFL